jgi:hypothetical protein
MNVERLQFSMGDGLICCTDGCRLRREDLALRQVRESQVESCTCKPRSDELVIVSMCEILRCEKASDKTYHSASNQKYGSKDSCDEVPGLPTRGIFVVFLLLCSSIQVGSMKDGLCFGILRWEYGFDELFDLHALVGVD